MKTKILLTILVVTFIAACNKDNYTTKPQLVFKEVNTTLLRPNEILKFTLEVTDAEGDIQDSIWIERIDPKCATNNITLQYKMPDFTATKNLKGDLEICYGYNTTSLGCPVLLGPGCLGRNDTATFKFWIRDKANNTSDTLTAPQPIVIAQ